MIKLRSSKMRMLRSNPYNYFKESKDITNLEMVKKGIKREAISYKLFEALNPNVAYQSQVSKSKTIYLNVELEGTPDIITKDTIYDIKNSKQSNDELVKAYTDQLNCYGYLFGIKKLYLFVDRNDNEEADINKCETIEIPYNPDYNRILEKVAYAIKVINGMNESLLFCKKDEAKDDLLNQLFKYKKEVEELNGKIKTIEARLDTPYENDLYSIHYEAKRKAKRSVTTNYTNDYEMVLKIERK